MNENELQRAIAKLNADYAEQLPGTVAQMQDLWQRLLAAENPSSQLTDLLRMAHSITGSGTTFGMPGASRAAGELEVFLEQFGKNGRPPGPAEQETVSVLLAALAQAARQH